MRWETMTNYRQGLIIGFCLGGLIALFAGLVDRRNLRSDITSQTLAVTNLVATAARLYFQLGAYCGGQVRAEHPEYNPWEIEEAARLKAGQVAPSDDYLKSELWFLNWEDRAADFSPVCQPPKVVRVSRPTR